MGNIRFLEDVVFEGGDKVLSFQDMNEDSLMELLTQNNSRRANSTTSRESVTQASFPLMVSQV